jgi:hypothetical protein
VSANPYYDPAAYGLELVGDVEWDDEPYQFNMTAVWRSTTTGQLYYADDSGRSCPSPFEDHSTEDLIPATRHEVLDRLSESPATAADLIERVQRLKDPSLEEQS